MPIRFRKSFRIFPGVLINFSRSGISTTVGSRGFHLTFNKNGVRQSVGIPGSGLSESSYLIKNGSEQNSASEHGTRAVGCFPWGCLVFIIIALAAVYFAANALGLLPANFLSHLLQQAGL